ncbi:MAG: hypothetical protein U9P71_09285 [Campylobacterota bacterium]|nr:hypothetical protein [Campylobacterota bacterium]
MIFLRSFSISLLLFAVTLFASSNNPFEHRAPFKSASISYSLDGTTQGSSVLYIKDYGKYLSEREKTSMIMFGFSKEEDKLTITTPDWIYTVDMLSKSGSKVTNMEKYLKQEYEKLSSSDKKTVQKNSKKFGTNVAQTMDGSVKFNAAMIHGYSCDKASMMGATTYSIHNTAILLKMEGTTLGMTLKKEATKIEKGAVDVSHFDVPSGVDITHDTSADAMMKQHAATMIQMLLNPNQKSVSATPPSVKEPLHPAPTDKPEPNDNKELEEAEEAVGKLFKSLF